MKICKNCGALINDDARFCTRCGADNMTDVENASQTTVNAEPSAQPQTDYQASANNDDVYYQPGNDYSNGNVNTYQYQQPTPKKKKFPAWIIVFIALVVIGGVLAVGVSAFKGESGGSTKISAGYNTGTEYINSSVNLKIDTTKGVMEMMSDAYRQYYDVSEQDIETFVCDMETGEYIFIEILEGNFYETNQDMKEFTKETIEYWYEDDAAAVISEVYEREIGGRTYTCADVSETVIDYEYGDYYMETTICFLREGSTFFEIDITTYPEETGNSTDSIINTYITQYAE